MTLFGLLAAIVEVALVAGPPILPIAVFVVDVVEVEAAAGTAPVFVFGPGGSVDLEGRST